MASHHHERVDSTKTQTTTATATKHDGHIDGHLNCVALRHGWSRTFSIRPDELEVLDYSMLESILELNTLRLRPMGLRIFVEHPPESGTWAKVKVWKHDTSLQAALMREFFEMRRRDGIITRVEVKDGAQRPDSDGLSLRSVGSRIAQGITGTLTKDTQTRPKDPQRRSWFPSYYFNFNRKLPPVPPEVEEVDVDDDDAQPPPPPPKQTSLFSLLRPHPKVGDSPTRRSIFDFFRSKPAIQLPPDDNTLTPEERREEEIDTLRKRGWMPPARAKRQRSLRDRIKANAGEEPSARGGTSLNPFFGSSRSLLSRAERRGGKGKNKASNDGDDEEGEEMINGDGHSDLVGHDPFGDDKVANDAELLTEQDMDDFFEIERSSQVLELSNRPGSNKPWSRFKPMKDRKVPSSSTGLSSGLFPATAIGKGPNGRPLTPSRGQLGGGAEIVSKPLDAFPDSPHRNMTPDPTPAEASNKPSAEP